MAEKNLAAVGAETGTETRTVGAQAELESQVQELKAEIARLTETVSAIGSGAKAVVQGGSGTDDSACPGTRSRRADFDVADGCRSSFPVWTDRETLKCDCRLRISPRLRIA